MANSTHIAIGARIRARRRALGLKQKTIADAVGISCQQVQKYETGANGIGPGRLQRIAQTLDVSVAFLFGSPEPVKNDPSRGGTRPEVDIFIASAECMDLSHAYLKISDCEVRRRVIDIVETLAGRRASSQVDPAANDIGEGAGGGLFDKADHRSAPS